MLGDAKGFLTMFIRKERMATRCFFLLLLVIVEAKTGTIA